MHESHVDALRMGACTVCQRRCLLVELFLLRFTSYVGYLDRMQVAELNALLLACSNACRVSLPVRVRCDQLVKTLLLSLSDLTSKLSLALFQRRGYSDVLHHLYLIIKQRVFGERGAFREP